MIILTGGGTGGHLSIIENLKTSFVQKGKKVIYIGSNNGLDKKWFEDDNIFSFKYFLPSRGFKKGVWYKIISFVYLMYSIMATLIIFKKHKITKVISVGGFSASPASIVAILFRYDLYIHEQNSIMGRLNNICKKYAKEIFCSFPQKNITLSPYPVKKEFFTYAKERQSLNTILFLGGSNGASFINNLAINTASFLNNLGINIIHQTGERDFQRIKEEYEKLNIKADVFDFSNNIYEKMQQSDIAISRAGASTLWELVSNGLPTLFIPYPYAIFDHQYHNAEFLFSKKLCFLFEQNALGNEKFCQEISKLHKLNSVINNISVKLKQLNTSNGVEYITECIIKKG